MTRSLSTRLGSAVLGLTLCAALGAPVARPALAGDGGCSGSKAGSGADSAAGATALPVLKASYGADSAAGSATALPVLKASYAAGSEKIDIVDTAVGAGNFTTLVTALKAAGLVDTLKGEGPFTVFAPTDEAFAKLPKGTLDALLKDPKKLAAVLTYHVVAGRVTAADVTQLKSAKTVQGSMIKIDTSSGVRINDANVVKADVMASNGVIHVIDKVILPPA